MSRPTRLYINFARIGDLVMSIPMIRVLSKEANFITLTRPFGLDILRRENHTQNLFLKHPNRRDSKFTKLWIRSPYDELKEALISLNITEVIMNKKEIPAIKSFISRALPQATIRTLAATRNRDHYSDYHRRLLESAGFETDHYNPVPQLLINEEDRLMAKDYLSVIGNRTVAIQLGAQKTDRSNVLRRRIDPKCPPWIIWTALIRWILEHDQADSILIHGSPREGALFKHLLGLLPATFRDRIHNGTQDIPISKAPAILQQCMAMISPDTGPAHIAAAVGCPLLALFGPSDHQFYRMTGDGPVELLIAPDNDLTILPCENAIQSWQNLYSMIPAYV